MWLLATDKRAKELKNFVEIRQMLDGGISGQEDTRTAKQIEKDVLNLFKRESVKKEEI